MPSADTFDTPRSQTRTGLVLFAMCLGVLMAQIDTSVVNLGAHAIGAALGLGVSALQWVLDVYNLVYATLLLTGGLLGDLFGRRRVFVVGVAMFAAGSLACGLAPDGTVLIAARAITGLGAALLLPASLSILAATYPDARSAPMPSASGPVATAWPSPSGPRSAASWSPPRAGAACSSWWCRWPPSPSSWPSGRCRRRPIRRAGASTCPARGWPCWRSAP